MRSWLIVVALVPALCAIVPAAGAPIGPGLDLAVVVDRSDSMREHPVSRVALHLLADIVARNGEAAQVRHRIAVIGFGSTVSVDITPAFAGPELSQRIDRLPTAARGQTDVLAALAAADRTLRSLGAAPDRRRAVVLLTDGVAYVAGADMDGYRAALRRFAQTHFSAGDPSLDVVLIVSPASERYAGLWREISHDRVRSVETGAASLLAEVHRVTARLAGTSTAEAVPGKTGGTLETLLVPPYLETVVLDVVRSRPEVRVDIFPPGAEHPLRGGVDSAESLDASDALSVLIVHRPPPGAWIIRKSRADAHVRILSQQFFPRGMLVRPALTDRVRQFDRIRVAYEIIDPSGRTLAELPDYRLSLGLELVRPDGSVEPMPMERSPEDGTTRFVAARESECALAGRYWTSVVVSSVDGSGQRVELFRDRWSGFSAGPAAPVDCRFGVAEDRWSSRIDVRVDCVDGDARAVDARSFATGSPERLFRPLLSYGDRDCDGALDLRYLGGGIWRGVLRGADRLGEYRLRLEADRALLRPSHNVRFVPLSLAFTRGRSAGLVWLPAAAVVAIALAALSAKQMRRRRVLPAKSEIP